MAGQFVIHHHDGSPAFYDIIITRDDAVSTFRIEQFDMLALLDGTEVNAEGIESGSSETAHLDEAISCDRGMVRLFDSGACVIERWSPPVFLIQVAGRQFYGTIHILKVKEGYSLRYIRSRTATTRRR